VAQHFDGGRTGQPAVICAPYGRPALAIARSIWNDLCGIGAETGIGGADGWGYPDAERAAQPFLDDATPEVDLIDGSWGPTDRSLRRGQLIRRSTGHALWRPELRLDGASHDRDAWPSSFSKMDLRLRAAARIPLAGDFRITDARRTRMLDVLADTDVLGFLVDLATRLGLNLSPPAWQELPEPDGYNTSHYAAYFTELTGATGRPAIRCELRVTVPDAQYPELRTVMDLRIAFDAIRPDSTTVPPELRITRTEVASFLSHGWHVTTMILPLTAVDDPIEAPPAGAPRLELHLISERPDFTGEARTVRIIDMIDFFAPRNASNQPPQHLSVGVTTHLGRSQAEILALVDDALAYVAEENGLR
jgi:hypothetical protein